MTEPAHDPTQSRSVAAERADRLSHDAAELLDRYSRGQVLDVRGLERLMQDLTKLAQRGHVDQIEAAFGPGSEPAHQPRFSGGNIVIDKLAQQHEVTSPLDGRVVARVPQTTPEILDTVVNAASRAQQEWAAAPVKERARVMQRAIGILEQRAPAIARLIQIENGKNIPEGMGSILRGLECIEYAAGLPQIISGDALEVSSGIECKTRLEPRGVVAGITPFNFPGMVPLWMAPMAMTAGNAFILKPSEKTPLTAIELAKVFRDAGLPPGIFSVVHGDKAVVENICEHPGIQNIAFVGSSAAAEAVYKLGTQNLKRVRALGGAKNHLVVLPDADPESTVDNVLASVTGCSGQRCMAASVLVAVGDVNPLLDQLEERMRTLVPGRDIGPLITADSVARNASYLEKGKMDGANLRLDGRDVKFQGKAGGYYVGASIIDNASPDHLTVQDEIFAPTLTIIRVDTLDDAIDIINRSKYGNAAAIYTDSASAVERFMGRVSAGMMGHNIGVPVPSEPFPFGGWNMSAFGDGDITGIQGLHFWTKTRKITSRSQVSDIGERRWDQ